MLRDAGVQGSQLRGEVSCRLVTIYFLNLVSAISKTQQNCEHGICVSSQSPAAETRRWHQRKPCQQQGISAFHQHYGSRRQQLKCSCHYQPRGGNPASNTEGLSFQAAVKCYHPVCLWPSLSRIAASRLFLLRT